MGYHPTSLGRTDLQTSKTAYPRFTGSVSGFRFFLPQIGRWVSRDPIMDALERTHHTEPIMVHGLAMAAIRGRGKDFIHEVLFVSNDPVDDYDILGLACQRVRYTTKYEFPTPPHGPFRLRGSIDQITETTRCEKRCADCSDGYTLEAKERTRGSALAEFTIPTGVPAIYVRVWGGGSAGGEFVWCIEIMRPRVMDKWVTLFVPR